MCAMFSDRENCTVFVSDLPSETTDDDLNKLFKDVCMVLPLPQHTL
jgi:RNA recognition motif-containing protein